MHMPYIIVAGIFALLLPLSAHAEASSELDTAVHELEKVFMSPESGQNCPQVQFFGERVLVDKTGTGKLAEYKYEFYPPNLVLYSRLLPPAHSSRCMREIVIIAVETNNDVTIAPRTTLDVGSYDACPEHGGGVHPESYIYDQKKKERSGVEFKAVWEQRALNIVNGMREVAQMCFKKPEKKRATHRVARPL